MSENCIRVGITGESGFIGRRLARRIDREGDLLRVPFDRGLFGREEALAEWAAGCDAVVHLAARNRPTDDPAVFETNVRLTETLIRALAKTANGPTPRLFFASSIREGEATAYGQSKKACRELFEAWATELRGNEGMCRRRFVNLRIPNVFGAGARAFDNSFIATFSWQLIRGEEAVVTEDRTVPLVDIDSLCGQIVSVVRGERREVEADFRMSVARVLEVLRGFWAEYRAAGRVSVPADRNLANLREVFLSYL